MTIAAAKKKLLREIAEAKVELARLRALPPRPSAHEIIMRALCRGLASELPPV